MESTIYTVDGKAFELQHHGVKGMRWGIRRFQKKDGSLTPTGKKRYHEDYEKAHDKKSVKEMSDKELRERNNRLQMERQYAQMTKKKNVGAKVISGLIATAGTIVALEGAYKTYSKYGNLALDKVGDWVVKGINLSGPVH
jgi:hypothetical protein